ncbi:MAG: hypothetical protein KDM63_13380 [Verrucomicrobiae bacterium]|nr:hypothetical protein [Verrucomicrobiae bacterium]MCB1091660.1 hypothetical protein [Verrucomicrobiae bacterium]
MSPPEGPILFLDFDGVLNHDQWVRVHGEFSFCPPNVAWVNVIVEQTGAQIVISSDWRLHVHWDRLCHRLMDAGLAVRPVDRTPLIPLEGPLEPRIPRGREIEAWRQTRRYDGSFVILDDRGDLEPHLDRLVQTDYELGLTEADAQRAIKMMQSSPSGANP